MAQRPAVLANLEAIRGSVARRARAERRTSATCSGASPSSASRTSTTWGSTTSRWSRRGWPSSAWRPDGTLSLTWYRGREWVAPHRAAWRVACAARDVVDQALRRRVGVRRLVDRWAREASVVLEVLGDMDYQHRHAPMSVTVWRRTR